MLIVYNIILMFVGGGEEGAFAAYQHENNILRQRIVELLAETEEKDVKYKELVKKIDDVSSSQSSLMG